MLNKLVHLSKQLYYQKRLHHAQSNSKLVWNIINEVTGKPNQIVNGVNKIRTNKFDIITDSKIDICNEFNDFFVNLGKNLVIEHISTNTLPPQDKTVMDDSIFLKQTDKDKIIKLLSKIKNHNSYFENMTNYVLKSISKSLPLSIIFNHSLSTGKYPTTFEKCIVIPLYKAGGCGNNHPISLSLTLTNIFEKCIKIRVLDYL